MTQTTLAPEVISATDSSDFIENQPGLRNIYFPFGEMYKECGVAYSNGHGKFPNLNELEAHTLHELTSAVLSAISYANSIRALCTKRKKDGETFLNSFAGNLIKQGEKRIDAKNLIQSNEDFMRHEYVMNSIVAQEAKLDGFIKSMEMFFYSIKTASVKSEAEKRMS